MATLSPTSEPYFSENLAKNNEGSSEEKLRSHKNFDDGQDSTDSTYVVDNIMRDRPTDLALV